MQTKRTESPGAKQKSRLAGSSQGEKLKKGKKSTHRENDNQLRLTGRTIIEGSQEQSIFTNGQNSTVTPMRAGPVYQHVDQSAEHTL